MFLDANVLIHAYGTTAGPKAKACARLMERVLKGEQKAATSTLVLEEVLNYFYRADGQRRGAEVIRHLRTISALEILPLEARAVERAGGILEEGVDSSDACHAATMEQHRIEVICSYDKGFDKIRGIRRQEPK